ncbi:cupin domain-containing protein [Brevibacterium zhoupengii]|uniref:cupin domain-containing protein n=1 Tax=Brevibacterium zhoupengii TaxID=2898795 RepID=UPI001E43E459|nr:cupin domain-containing protein [Brevibacterium zhoupengii]
MSALEPISTHDFPLEHEPIEDWQRLDDGVPTRGRTDNPTTAFAELGTIAGAEYGLWEMSAGTMRDIEDDEVFIVISGNGRIDFDDMKLDPIDLSPGTLVRLEEGMTTWWYVDDAPLRKLYIAPGEDWPNPHGM